MTLRRVAVAALLLGLALAAQVTPSRWGSVASFGWGAIDRAMLANNLVIPIYFRATGAGAQVALRLQYNSQFWSATGSPYEGWSPAAGFGWRLEQPSGTLEHGHEEYGQYCGFYNDDTGQYDEWYNLITDYWTLTEPDGTSGNASATSEYLVYGGGTHQRGDDNNCPGVGGNDGAQIPDGKGYTIAVYNGDTSSAYAEAFDSNGDEIDGLLKDPNGNEVTTTTSNGSTSYFDPLSAANGNAAALTQTGAGTPSSPVYYAYTGANGNPAQIEEQFESLSITTALGCGTHPEWSGTATVPSELDFPDGTKYQFAYDSDARLSSVTLPTGATIHYGYTIDCNGGASDTGNDALTRWDSVNGQNLAWSWNRSQQGGGGAQTLETDPYGNDGVYTFAAPYWPGESGALTAEALYSGSHSSGTELEAAAITNTLTSDYVSEQVTNITSYGSTDRHMETILAPNSLGQPLYQYTYDWSTCFSCGPLLRNITTSYTSPAAGMIVPSVTTVSPNTGSGGQIAQTNYTYQNGTGNPLSVREYVNSTTALTQSFTYNANGTVATATDPNGAVTTYSYGDSASGGCTDAGGRGLFPTLIQSPVSAVKTTASWNCVGGVLASSTDANNNITTFAYADAANDWRPSSVTDAAGNTASLTYPSGGYPGQSESSMTFNGGNSIVDTVTTVDGLGRTILSQRRQGPSSSSYDIEQTTYDAMDRPSTVSAPYSGLLNDMSAGAVTTTIYDALSRPLSVTDGDGGTTGYSYTENDVLLTRGPAPGGENTKRKQEEMDGLGRLTSVCELTSTANGGGSCGQNTAQTGYWTQYTLDALGDITAVAQNAQGTAQGRSFSFDWLGRLTAETNPESGTTSYAFDADSTCGTSGGDLVKRLDAAGNTTCYAHDALHRVTQISYSGPNAGATPTKTFVYDSDSGLAIAGLAGYPASNLAGRLVEAYTGPGTGPATVVGFAYDPLGKAVYAAEETPSSGGWNAVGESYYPNGAVATLALPGNLQISYGLEGEGRPATVGDSWGNTPVRSTSYSPVGLTAVTLGSNDSDVYQRDPTGRMTQYQVTVGGSTATGTVGWNANGSLGSLAIADPIPGATDNGMGCTYTHDDLGRLSEANCASAYDETFSWDPFGNHNSGHTPSGLATSFSFSNNRIAGGDYDSNGNLLEDPILPQVSNQFDAEGRAVSFWGATAVYDALGREVQTGVSGSWGPDAIIYAPDGAKLGLMSSGAAIQLDIPLPGGGAAVYNASGLQYYRHADWLGSAVITSSSSRVLLSSTHYTPFGFDETGAGAGYRSFTGAKQLTDSMHTGGQYDFLFREYNPEQGRWWTPDPAGLAAVDPNNPQSWNRYAYVAGTPLAATDPLGLEAVQPCPDNGDCEWDDWGCTLDGMAEDCATVQGMAAMGGGGGIAPCPSNDCSGTRAVEGYGGSTIFEQWVAPTLVGHTFCAGCDLVDGQLQGGAQSPGDATYRSGFWQAVGTNDSCGWGAVCYFFTGIAGAGVNENPLGIVQSAAAAAVPVAAFAGGAAATAWAPDAIAAARFYRIQALYSPRVMSCAGDVLSGLLPGAPAPSACGAIGEAVGHWGAVWAGAGAIYGWASGH